MQPGVCRGERRGSPHLCRRGAGEPLHGAGGAGLSPWPSLSTAAGGFLRRARTSPSLSELTGSALLAPRNPSAALPERWRGVGAGRCRRPPEVSTDASAGGQGRMENTPHEEFTALCLNMGRCRDFEDPTGPSPSAVAEG